VTDTLCGMTSYHDIFQLLAGIEDFELPVRGRTTLVRRDSPDSWIVYLDEIFIGRFRQVEDGRATYFKSEIAGEPGTTNWVSDDVTTLISRMIDLRD
jgi:hypothetical protein